MNAIFPPLTIPHTLAAGPGPGNTDPRVLERFVAWLNASTCFVRFSKRKIHTPLALQALAGVGLM